MERSRDENLIIIAACSGLNPLIDDIVDTAVADQFGTAAFTDSADASLAVILDQPGDGLLLADGALALMAGEYLRLMGPVAHKAGAAARSGTLTLEGVH